MSEDTRNELHQLMGASNAIALVLEEMQQWLEEAQDESKQEALENVVGHLSAVHEEYRRRRDALEKALAGS